MPDKRERKELCVPFCFALKPCCAPWSFHIKSEVGYNIYMQNTLSPNLQTLLDNRLRYLSPIVGEAINSFDWSSKLIDIGRKFGLHVDEMEDFQSVVVKSMIGLISPDQFEQELISALALSPANAEKVIAALNAQVFEPIHDYVLKGKPSDDVMAKTGIVIDQDTRNSNQDTNTEPVQNSPTLHAETTEIDLGTTMEPKVAPSVAPVAPTVPADEEEFADFFNDK